MTMMTLVDVATPQERHSTTEIQITTPIKPRMPGRLILDGSPGGTPGRKEGGGNPDDSGSNAQQQPGLGGGFVLVEDNEESEELMDDPVYAWLVNNLDEDDYDNSLCSKKSRLPSALPLQKVMKRKAEEMEETSDKGQKGPVCYEESDGEVVILMDGIMTKVGKPSETANSGKIYSTALNCPITVKWLLENFESMVGQSLPRSFVYDQYVQHCTLNKIESVNAASFGKLIRSVFLGLRTRRLGTRGNSKYHYYGIKIKESSFLLPILNSIRAEQDTLNDTVNGRIRKRVRRTQSVYTGKHVKGLVIDKKIEAIDNLGTPPYQFPDMSIKRSNPLPEGVDEAMLISFEDIYKRHCLKLVNFFREFKLIDILAEVANFWRLSLTFKRKGLEDYSSILPKPALFKILSLEATDIFVARMDLYLYQHVINILTPSVLQPLPLQMLQAVDNMIQDILSILSIALNGLPKAAAFNKLRCLTAFVRVWKQYSKLSQLSDFISLTLENENYVSSMRHNIKAIRLAQICQRAAVDVESATMNFKQVFRMMTSFAQTLDKDQSLDLWVEWTNKELFQIVGSAPCSTEQVERVTADLQSCWLIVSNLVVNAIREMSGSDSSLFVPLLQWCGELMQYNRQRILDDMRKVMPVTRFYMALMDEDMSICFMDKHKAKPLTPTLPPPPSEEDVLLSTLQALLPTSATAPTTDPEVPETKPVPPGVEMEQEAEPVPSLTNVTCGLASAAAAPCQNQAQSSYLNCKDNEPIKLEDGMDLDELINLVNMNTMV